MEVVYNTDHFFINREEWDCSSSVAPAITLTSNYVMSTTAEVAGEFIYGRYGNPSRNNLEAVLAALEDSKYALTFASGKSRPSPQFLLICSSSNP